jgi:hypothetical protein
MKERIDYLEKELLDHTPKVINQYLNGEITAIEVISWLSNNLAEYNCYTRKERSIE